MRKGLIPTILGTAVTGVSLAARAPDIRKRGIKKKEMGCLQLALNFSSLALKEFL